MNEPQLQRDFMFMLNGQHSWDDISVSIQTGDIDVSPFENIIGVAITADSIDPKILESIKPRDTGNPVPDFLLYNNKTLIVGEVKKTGEVPIAQLKNQVNYLVSKLPDTSKRPLQSIKTLTWTDILSSLIIPYELFNKSKGIKTIWATEFREYVTYNYSDWLPAPPLDKIPAGKLMERPNFQLAEKRLFDIQALTSFGAAQYWIGGRRTMDLEFPWATEAMVKLEEYGKEAFVCITIWPANTKTQGTIIFNKDLKWTTQERLRVGENEFEMDNNAYIKFSHIMGKYISDFYFDNNVAGKDKPILTKDNFYKICHSWGRDDWPKLKQALDDMFDNKLDWKAASGWEENFENSNRTFVFISLGTESNIYIPLKVLQEREKTDPSGQSAANLIEETIFKFRNLVDGV